MEAILLQMLEELAMKELAILVPEVGELIVAAIAALVTRIKTNNPGVDRPVQDASQLAMDVVRRMEAIDFGSFLTKDQIGRVKANAALNDLLGQAVEHGLVLAQNDAELLIRDMVEVLRTKLAAVADRPVPASPPDGLSRGSLGAGYGWLPDTPDHRDALFAAAPPLGVAIAPSSDLRGFMPPIGDQGRLGSCTANALGNAVACLMKRDRGHSVPFSRLFIYYNERALEHTVGRDAGAQIRDGVKSLHAQGACFEANWPYDIRRFAEKPNPGCYAQGEQFQVTSYLRLNSQNLDELLACLSAGFPFVFGASIYPSFESPEVTRTGIVPMPGTNERLLGGHALCCVGHDTKRRAFLVANSWSARWGQAGYCWIPFNYLTSPLLADDFWSIRAGENI